MRTTYHAVEAEKIHAELYKEAKESAESGKDIEIGKVYICPSAATPLLTTSRTGAGLRHTGK